MSDETRSKPETDSNSEPCLPCGALADAEADGDAPEESNPEAAPGAQADSETAVLSERLDHALRALAEAENARKRAERDRETTAKYAVTKFAGDILAVADNLHRALGVIPADGERTEAAVDSLIEGVQLTGRELDNVLARHGIEKIDPTGRPFDHNLHEVLFEVEAPDQAPGTVVQVMQHGYRIHDRLLRPARVGVAKKPAPASDADSVDTQA